MQDKNKDALKQHGGVQGLAQALVTDTANGLKSAAAGDLSIDGRKQAFGANKFKEVQQKAFFALLWENLQDPILILLMVAAAVSDPVQ